MPYNNAPIQPPDEVTGSSNLPLARVKKIIAQDEDIAQCSNSAAFAISVATEIFIRYLTEQAYTVVKSERKPRRNIAYKDLAVARIDNLEFLADVIPKTKTYRQFKEEKAQEEAAAKKVQRGPDGLPNGVNGESSRQGQGVDQMMQQQQQRQSIGGPVTNGIAHTQMPMPAQSMNGSPIVDRTLHPSPHGHPDPIRDIEMTG